MPVSCIHFFSLLLYNLQVKINFFHALQLISKHKIFFSSKTTSKVTIAKHSIAQIHILTEPKKQVLLRYFLDSFNLQELNASGCVYFYIRGSLQVTLFSISKANAFMRVRCFAVERNNFFFKFYLENIEHWSK